MNEKGQVLILTLLGIRPYLDKFLSLFKGSGRAGEDHKQDFPEEDDIVESPDQDIGSEFRVDGPLDTSSGQRGEAEQVKKIYQPAAPGDADYNTSYDLGDKKEDPLKGYAVEVKELPEPELENIDASWIDLDVTRDFKHIMKELENRSDNCYEILGLSRNASTKDIHKAYRKLASQYHPDRGTSIEGMNDDELRDRIRDINFSKEILLDPTMRALHDKMVRERKSPDETAQESEPLDLSVLSYFSETGDEARMSEDEVIEMSVRKKGEDYLGVIFFRKWEENLENFGQELLDYIIQLDEGGYVDYGRVLRGDIVDMDELIELRKISNYSQAVNNALLEVWVRPPFYYMALPVISREHIQEICDILKDSFELESLFFDYPLK